MKKPKVINVLIHIAVLLIVLLIPYFPKWDNMADLKRSFINPLYAISFVLFTGFVYLNYLYLIEAFYLKRKFVTYSLCISAALITILYIPEVIAYAFNMKPDRVPNGQQPFLKPPQSEKGDYPHPDFLQSPPPRPPQYSDHSEEGNFHDKDFSPPLNPKMSIIVFFFISIFLSISIQTDKRLQRIENEKLIAELAQLKAQINPHFLFNTLNSIYALVMRKDGKAGESIQKLADLMRYILVEAQNSTVPLAHEIAFINNYMALQRHRLTEYMVLDYQVTGKTDGKRIAPLLLMTFIENAFKYGINPDEDCVIHIYMAVEEQDLILKVANKKVPLSPNQLSSGIGLANTTERLQLLYPSKYNLDIKETMTSYSVELTLTLI